MCYVSIGFDLEPILCVVEHGGKGVYSETKPERAKEIALKDLSFDVNFFGLKNMTFTVETQGGTALVSYRIQKNYDGWMYLID